MHSASLRVAAVALAFLVTFTSATVSRAANTTDLAVRFTAVSFRNGSTGIYTVSITNNGPAATNDLITVSLSLPDQFYLISGGNNDFSCLADGGTVACTRSTSLASGRTTSLQVRVGVCSPFSRVSTQVSVIYSGDSKASNNSYARVTSVRAGACVPSPTPTRTLTPTRTWTSTPGSPVPTATLTPTLSPMPTNTPTATATPVAALTDLRLIKMSSGTARVATNYNYILTITNAGPNTTNIPVGIVDTLPNGLSYVGASGSGWTCAADGQLVNCTYTPAIAVGGRADLTLTVRVTGAAFPTVTNTAVLVYSGDTDSTNNTGRRPTTVRR